MTRDDAIPCIGYCLDDALSVRSLKDMPDNAVLVGWQCGFEPLFVAVWSYLPGHQIDAESAVEIAGEYLQEIGWFDGSPDCEEPRDPDYVLE